MPTQRLQFLIAVVAIVVLALPAVTRAGDAPILVVGDWGIGEIDGKLMFYLGKGRYFDTPIPAPPHGPRWDIAYNAFPFVVAGSVGLWLCSRRHKQTLPIGANGRAFEVQRVSDS